MKLYKYRTWNEYSEDIILNQRIFIPSKTGLNDLSEAIHPIKFEGDFHSDRMDEGWHKIMKGNLMASLIRFGRELNLYKAENRWGWEPKNATFEKFSHIKNNDLLRMEYVFDQIEDTHTAIESYVFAHAEDYALMYLSQAQAIERVNNKLESIGIYSLSAKPNDPVMWAHYSNSHNGLIFIFDSTFVPLFSKARKVNYITERPVISIDNICDILYTKYVNWSYEEEFRILKKESGLHTFNKDALTGLIFGAKMSDETISKAVDLCHKSGFNLKFYKSKISSTSYLTDIEELNF